MSDTGGELFDLPRSVKLREVGPRDGLQGEVPLPPAKRAELALALAKAGCRHLEAASFVSEKAVPAMAGASQVMELLRSALAEDGLENVTLTCLVPNTRGANAALESQCDELSVTISASPAYNEKNVRRSIEDSCQEIREITRLAAASSVPVDAVISCAFGSPFGEVIEGAFVAELASRLVDAGCEAITLADTTGLATPPVLAGVLQEVSRLLPEMAVGLHLHETRGTALLNAYVALGLGVTRFDTALGGLGGSPFAKGAGGNLSTEDFASLLHSLGVATGVDLEALLGLAAGLPPLIGHDIASKVRTEP